MDIIENNYQKNIINFLKEVIQDIESENISEEKLDTTRHFLFTYKFHHHIENQKIDDIDEKDMIKFLFLGWYIYTFILNTKSKKD